jgi:peptide/nickel transport system permease protein
MATAQIAITPEPEAAQVTGIKGSSLLSGALSLWRTRIGLALMVALAAVALLGPFVARFGQTQPVPGMSPNMHARGDAFFGTDNLGYDVLSRFLYGGRAILGMGVAATAMGLVLGVAIGLIAAYGKGWIDEVLMRLMDVILAFPQIMLALVALATLGASYWLIIVIVGITTMPRVARVARGAAQPIVERDFVAAAEVLGVSRLKIIVGEIMPNVLGALMVEASLRLTYSIGLIASLAFLGFSPAPTSANWGTMIQENRLALTVQPWGVVLPVVAIALLTIGTGLFGDGIARASVGIDRKRGGE